MTPYEQYYVYFYVEEDETIVYVGKGTASRAWYTRENTGSLQKQKNVAKLQWYEKQLSVGRLPCDWVRVVHRGLTNADALKIEKHYIKTICPSLNILGNPKVASHARKVTDKDIQNIRALREEGVSWFKIGEKTGYSPMTAWRAINVGLSGNL